MYRMISFCKTHKNTCTETEKVLGRYKANKSSWLSLGNGTGRGVFSFVPLYTTVLFIFIISMCYFYNRKKHSLTL